jgi:hypothetical protein
MKDLSNIKTSPGVHSIHLEEATVQIPVDFDDQKVEKALYNLFFIWNNFIYDQLL